MKKVQVAVDTGGTFSDFTYLDESGALQSFKVPSTPAEPEQAVIQGLRKIVEGGVRPDLIDLFIHGTTVGTNTLLQEHGSKTALVITEGFDAIYEVQEQARPYGKEIFLISDTSGQSSWLIGVMSSRSLSVSDRKVRSSEKLILT